MEAKDKIELERYLGEPRGFSIDFEADPLEAFNKTIEDITDAFINFKIHTDTDSDDRYFEESIGSGKVILDKPNFKFTLILEEDNYHNLKAGETRYSIILAAKVTGLTKKIVLPLKENYTIKITAPKNRT